jgi:hypothetical protein
MPDTRHVVPAEGGGWLVIDQAVFDKYGGATLFAVAQAASFERKRDAEAFAKNLVREGGGGRVVLHTPSGSITEVDTVGSEASGAVA